MSEDKRQQSLCVISNTHIDLISCEGVTLSLLDEVSPCLEILLICANYSVKRNLVLVSLG